MSIAWDFREFKGHSRGVHGRLMEFQGSFKGVPNTFKGHKSLSGDPMNVPLDSRRFQKVQLEFQGCFMGFQGILEILGSL